MERRVFLKGLFGGVTSAGIVIAASRPEIEAFASPLVKDAPLVLDQPTVSPVGCGEHLYNAAGELVAIVTQLDLSVEPVDATMGWDSHQYIVPGRRTIKIAAVGVGTVEWTGREPRLRGVRA